MLKKNFLVQRIFLLVLFGMFFFILSSIAVKGENELPKEISIDLIEEEAIENPIAEEDNFYIEIEEIKPLSMSFDEDKSEDPINIESEKILSKNVLSNLEEENFSEDKKEMPANPTQSLTEGREEIYLELEQVLNKTLEDNLTEEFYGNNQTFKINATEELFGEENSTFEKLDEENNLTAKEEIQNSKEDSNLDKSYSYIKLDEIVQNETVKVTSTNTSSPKSEKDSKIAKNITYVFYSGNKKIMETKGEEGKQIEFTSEKKKKEIETKLTENEENKTIIYYNDEIIEEDDNGLKKEVKVYSDEHFENELRVFTDIIESEESQIKIYWQEEDKYLDFETYDENSNGLVERISWIVPHLSNQTFEIIVNFNKEEDLNIFEILIETIDSPNNITNDSKVNFEFNISYKNMSMVECDFLLNGNGINENQTKSESFNYSLELGNGSYIWNLDCYDKNNFSINNASQGSFIVAIDYTSQIEFTLSKKNISEGESVTFQINISTLINSTINYKLDFGNGDEKTGFMLNTNKANFLEDNFYNLEGSYKVNLTTYIDYVPYERLETITVNPIAPTNYEDNESPLITLIEPEDNKIVYIENKNSSISFSYKASDNVKIDNCTFSLYYFGKSDFSEAVNIEDYGFNKTLKDNEEVKLSLKDFDEGDYSWYIECLDNSSNVLEKYRDFAVIDNSINETPLFLSAQTNENQNEIDRVENLIESINEFFIKEEKYDSKTKEVVSDIGILEDLKFYKKKLLQMKLDIKHNIDYIKDSEKREKRLEEIVEDVREYEKKIPESVNVIDSYEYQKNSLEFNVEEIVHSYIESKGIILNKRKIDGMVRQNEFISNFIISSADIKQVQIEYNNSVEKITLITKKIKIKNESFDSFIEIIPKEVAENSAEIIFINNYKVIKQDQIFEIKKEDLKEDKLIYYVKRIVEFDEIEKTNTMPFIEESTEENFNPLTGMVSFFGIDTKKSIWFLISWSLVLIIAYFIISSLYRNFQIKGGKNKKEIEKILDLVLHAKEFLEKKDVDRAKEIYHKISEEYSLLPENSRKFIFKKIEKLRVEIDKKDISSLIKEFTGAMKEGRKEDALLIYKDINKIYPRMPKRYKRVVYEKVIPYV